MGWIIDDSSCFCSRECSEQHQGVASPHAPPQSSACILHRDEPSSAPTREESPAYSLTFDLARHEYRIDGEPVPSVTQILDAAEAIKGKAYFAAEHALRGTAVHMACQYDDEGALDESSVDPRLKGYVDAWRAFKRFTRVEIIANELRLGSLVDGFAGTLDRIASLPSGPDGARELWIIDIKTGASHDWHDLQLAGYDLLVEANATALGLEPIAKLGTVSLSSDGKFALQPQRSSRARLRDAFRTLLDQWRAVRAADEYTESEAEL